MTIFFIKNNLSKYLILCTLFELRLFILMGLSDGERGWLCEAASRGVEGEGVARTGSLEVKLLQTYDLL